MMPDGSYTVDALLKFLKQAGMEGLINPASARSRRNAIEQLYAEMTEDERLDVRRLDVDDLASRFHKLEGSSIRVEALALYVERFKLALVDFLKWHEQPAAFETIGSERARALSRKFDGRPAIDPDQQAAERIRLQACDNPSDVIPVAIRSQHTVYLAGLPIDLTPAEADKIAGIVRAFARSKGSNEKDDAA